MGRGVGWRPRWRWSNDPFPSSGPGLVPASAGYGPTPGGPPARGLPELVASGDRVPHLTDEAVLNRVPGRPHGIDDRPGPRRPVADDADTVDAEQHGPAVGVRVEFG